MRRQFMGIGVGDRWVGVDGGIGESVDVVKKPVTDLLGYIVSL